VSFVRHLYLAGDRPHESHQFPGNGGHDLVGILAVSNRMPAVLTEAYWGFPMLLTVVELFHPHPGDLLNPDVQTWLVVHYIQILLLPLSAVAMAALVRGRADIGAVLCRVAMFIFAVSYISFDTAAGVVTGIIVKAAQASGTPDAWRAPIDAVWAHPIMGGSPLIPAPFLAVLGSVALSVGAVAAAVSLKRSGSSWAPVVLLALSSFGIAIFKTHPWPGGPLTFGELAVAAAWLQPEHARQSGVGIDSAARHDDPGDAR
jgi:hypothetical protein